MTCGSYSTRKARPVVPPVRTIQRKTYRKKVDKRAVPYKSLDSIAVTELHSSLRLQLEADDVCVTSPSSDRETEQSPQQQPQQQDPDLTAIQEQEVIRAAEELQWETGSSDDLITALGAIFKSLAVPADQPKRPSRFHSTAAPSVGVDAYLTRLHKYFRCCDACFISSLVYVDRIVKLHPEFSVNSLTIHRLLATSVVLSAKFHDDVYYSNAYYAKVCGLSLKELNMLEALFIKMLNWKLDVSPEEYRYYRDITSSAHNGDAIPGPR